MNNQNNDAPYNNSSDNYPGFSEAIQSRFAAFANKSLFTTSTTGLFEAFIHAMPKEAQQHYTCSCCRNFINRFGGLVSISEEGEAISVLWDPGAVPAFFTDSVEAMKRIVSKASVNGVFLSFETTLGTPHAGGWDHLSVPLLREQVLSFKDAGQLMADKKEDYRILVDGLEKYDRSVLDQAAALLESESLARSDKFLGAAKFAQEMHEKRANAKNHRLRDNLTWLAVAEAPAGFTRISSSMIGTLLDDIAAGCTFEEISRRFAAKVSPGVYQRAQTAPSEGNIQQAEKIVAALKLENSLKRRYAAFAEIPEFIWKAEENEPVKSGGDRAGGVFANITPRAKEAPAHAVNPPKTVMTWDKFLRTVVPTADRIEVLANNANRFMALVTADDEEAPNILQWDNTFSWYYHGGIDGEIKRRVENAGGQYEGNEIRCSLIWEGYTDLDLHAYSPHGEHIFFGKKQGDSGGWLDVDANGGSAQTFSPVENIRWSQGRARDGRYEFKVHNYCERGRGTTPFKVELEVNGKIYAYNGVAGSTNWETLVFSFDYIKGQQPAIRSNHAASAADAWNIPANTFARVKGITRSPNLWGDNKAAHTGHHIFFLLDGCKDTTEGKGRGFLVETLKSELHEVRKTLEQYTAMTPILAAEHATACGMGYSKDSEWNLTVRVTSGTSTRLIYIDRFD
ncbi:MULTISPECIES: YfaP family protein [Paenibacillus]|uniref:YfaP family protein n=1 Tax=Paenibacillus TaxID=44249 RepID=UPI0022B8ADF0|nr:hypothetical protein [Paenibacillus caseinilyticus]MCZ8523027.1 hypothetical protein [Paenibacillus caseinilyticus]